MRRKSDSERILEAALKRLGAELTQLLTRQENRDKRWADDVDFLKSEIEKTRRAIEAARDDDFND